MGFLCGAAGDSVISVYERAMAQVWLRLEALAQQHGVMDQLQVFVAVRPPTDLLVGFVISGSLCN